MNSIFKKIFKSKNIKNSIWIIGEQVFQMIISLVVGILSARYLGPTNYGSLNYTASFVSLFLSFASLGMEGVIIKRFVDEPNKEGEYIGSCIVFRIISSCLCILSITFIIYFLNPSEPIKIFLAILQSIQLVFRSFYILDYWFQRHLKSRYVSIGKMVACLCVSAYKIFLLIAQKNILWFAFSNSLSEIIIAFFLYFFYKRQNSQKLSYKTSTGLSVLKDSFHFIISDLMVAIYSQMDKIMIGKMMLDTDVGYYTTAIGICAMWAFIPNAIIFSFRPMIMEIKKSGNELLYKKRLTQLYSGIIWICIFISCLICIFAEPIIGILYGKEYYGAVAPLRIAIWFETFAMIGNARSIWIICERKNKYVKYYLAIGAFVNLILNFFMIKKMGIEGAALATLITQITTSIIAPLFFKETRIHSKIVFDAFFCKWLFNKGKKEII